MLFVFDTFCTFLYLKAMFGLRVVRGLAFYVFTLHNSQLLNSQKS